MNEVNVSEIDKPARRPRSAAAGRMPGVPQATAGLRAEQVAFLGEYTVNTKEKRIDVQILCWPTVSAAWSTLTQSMSGLQSLHKDDVATSKRAPGSSWLQSAAPQLCGPIDRESQVIESTLATLIRRLPLRMAVAVVEHQAGQAVGSDAQRYRSLFSGCLTAYDAYLKSTKQPACRLIIAPAGAAAQNDIRRSSYNEALPYLDSAARLGSPELAFWPEDTLPLPLEVAQLAAAAAGHHLQHPSQSSPLFETVRAHLVAPSRFHAPSRLKRRK